MVSPTARFCQYSPHFSKIFCGSRCFGNCGVKIVSTGNLASRLSAALHREVTSPERQTLENILPPCLPVQIPHLLQNLLKTD